MSSPVNYSTLHKNILVHTFSYLGIRDIGTSARVCKRWYQIVKDPHFLWKLVYQQKNPTKDLQFQHEHLDRFNNTFFDSIKKSIIFSKNISKGTYTYQEVPGYLHINKYLYNFDERVAFQENKVIEVFDTRLGTSCKIKNEYNMPMKILYTYPDRMVTQHKKSPESQEIIECVWDIHSNKPIAHLSFPECAEFNLPQYVSMYTKFYDGYFINATKNSIKVCHIKTGKIRELSSELTKKIDKFFSPRLKSYSIVKKELFFFNAFNQIVRIDLETEKMVTISVNCKYKKVHSFGSYIMALPHDRINELHRWDSKTGKRCSNLEIPARSYYKYESFLVFIADNKVKVFDVAKNDWVHELYQDDIEDGDLLPILSFDMKKTLLITVSKCKIKAWCIKTGKVFYDFEGKNCGDSSIFSKAKKNYIMVLGPTIASLHLFDARYLTAKKISIFIEEEPPGQRYFSKVIGMVSNHLFIALQNINENFINIFNININSGKIVQKIILYDTLENIGNNKIESMKLVGHSLVIRWTNKKGNPVTRIYQFGVPFQIHERCIEEPKPKNKKCIIC